MRFLDELKRRRVVRVALVYGGVGFGVLQGADVLVPALQLPGSINTGMAALVILGFPLALALAWAFDLGPEGVRRTGAAVVAAGGTGAEAERKPERALRWIGRRTLLAAGAPALLGLGLGAGWVLRPVGDGGGTGSSLSRHCPSTT